MPSLSNGRVKTRRPLVPLPASEPYKQQRRWQRLPLALPVFVKGVDLHGRDFQDFTAAFDINAGGVLLASRRYLPESSVLTLEIPSLPSSQMPQTKGYVRSLRARVLYSNPSDGYFLCGLEFTGGPLLPQGPERLSKSRKA